MATAALTLDGLTVGGAPATIMLIGFSWAADLKTCSVSSEAGETSAQLALLQVTGTTTNGSLVCFDDAGTQYLSYTFTAATVSGYSLSGGAQKAVEQYLLSCATVEMTSGSSQTIIS